MIAPETCAPFVPNIQDVLHIYQRPHHPTRPFLSLDETSKQLIVKTRAPIPVKPEQPARHHYEYERLIGARALGCSCDRQSLGVSLASIKSRHRAMLCDEMRCASQ